MMMTIDDYDSDADDYAGDDLLSHFLDLLWWEPSTLSSCCPEKLRVTDLVFFI